MPRSIITSKGQITIPKTVRNSLNLKTGDTVDFILRDGEVRLVPVSRSVSDVFGLLYRKNRKAYSDEQIAGKLKDAVRDGNR